MAGLYARLRKYASTAAMFYADERLLATCNMTGSQSSRRQRPSANVSAIGPAASWPPNREHVMSRRCASRCRQSGIRLDARPRRLRRQFSRADTKRLFRRGAIAHTPRRHAAGAIPGRRDSPHAHQFNKHAASALKYSIGSMRSPLSYHVIKHDEGAAP